MPLMFVPLCMTDDRQITAPSEKAGIQRPAPLYSRFLLPGVCREITLDVVQTFCILSALHRCSKTTTSIFAVKGNISTQAAFFTR